MSFNMLHGEGAEGCAFRHASRERQGDRATEPQSHKEVTYAE